MTHPTTTVRLRVSTKARLEQHRRDGQSIDDVVAHLADTTMTCTEVTETRDGIGAYVRTHLVPSFLDQDEMTAGEALWHELRQLQHPAAAGSAPAAAVAGEATQDPPVASVPPVGVVLDHTALVALGAGHRLLARLIYTQPAQDTRKLFAPASAILHAAQQRPGVNTHVVRLGGVITGVDLDLEAVSIVGARIPDNVHPAVGHVLHVAQPSSQWPMGRPVLTALPVLYEPYPVKVRPIPER